MTTEYTLSSGNLHICDSWKIRSKREMTNFLADVETAEIEQISAQGGERSKVWNRSYKSLIREWRGHNLLYDLHLFRSHTKDVDLNYPTTWYMEVGYFLLSLFYIGI